MKRIKRAEQAPLHVVWRGDMRELGLFTSELGFGCSRVRRIGNDFNYLSIWQRDTERSLDIVKEWLKAHGDLVHPKVKVRMSFSRPTPKMKKLRVDESPPPPEGSIERLRKEWAYFQETGCCPKCDAVILGPSIVYDDTFDKMCVISCICGKHLFGGSAHLERAKQMMETPTKGHTHRRRAPVSV